MLASIEAEQYLTKDTEARRPLSTLKGDFAVISAYSSYSFMSGGICLVPPHFHCEELHILTWRHPLLGQGLRISFQKVAIVTV